jgi:SAM-dependent methyltransferase
VEDLPFPDQTIDVVVAMALLCLVPDQTTALREAARVLRPGDKLVVAHLGWWNAWAGMPAPAGMACLGLRRPGCRPSLAM